MKIHPSIHPTHPSIHSSSVCCLLIRCGTRSSVRRIHSLVGKQPGAKIITALWAPCQDGFFTQYLGDTGEKRSLELGLRLEGAGCAGGGGDGRRFSPKGSSMGVHRTLKYLQRCFEDTDSGLRSIYSENSIHWIG